MNIDKPLKIEKDKYGYPIENCDVVITLKDNQIIKGKYDSDFGFMTSDGREIWETDILSYKVVRL
jgi:hypothetical protein